MIDLLVLNYNGRDLLPECLPSVVEAAAASHHPCRVAVIDNASTDDSVAFLRREFPAVRVIQCPNRGLCSFNEVVAGLEGPVAVLLNNDIKLDRGAIDPLVAPLLARPRPGTSPCFMTAPQCRLFDGTTYEGLKTAVRWRFGLVQATALFERHESAVDVPDLTASAGAVLAVDRGMFVELGGFDPLYLPGRLEDLDFAFRGYLAGYHGRYVPESLAFHRGAATFGAVFGRAAYDQLALRNTLLFQWKNLRHPIHILRQLAGYTARLAWDVCRAAWVPPEQRWPFARALYEAMARAAATRKGGHRPRRALDRERRFFRRFHPRVMAGPA